MKFAPCVTAAALMLGASFGAMAAEPADAEQVCQARATALSITDEMRETYMRECLAGERLDRKGTSSR
ncbi:hypothetical protein DK427_01775 [Methylobacterium radiodurans]|uniref:PsiF repeat protein n=1 Tax=Methylobacterium radiodurans TaxID=2202828 RepID=A0A2U8VMH6_9HYPH|nr:hypothetical protein DK427_01775 [Methylobacterium radiodurans]